MRVLIVGLTGGIGCGKSAVAQAFASLGAMTIDADQLAREAIERGSTGFDEVIARFGDVILKDGDIDRTALAGIVFNDPQAKRDLESIIHPRVQGALAERISRLSPGEILIYEIPLLVETGAQDKFDFIITVEASLENRLQRLQNRGMTAGQAQARIDAQSPRSARESIADVVIVNDGDKYDLLRQVENLWESTLLPMSVE